MRPASLAFLVAFPAFASAADADTVVAGRQQERPVSFEGGLATYYEGLVVALLGNCTSESGPWEATKERWDEFAKGEHLRVTFALDE